MKKLEETVLKILEKSILENEFYLYSSKKKAELNSLKKKLEHEKRFTKTGTAGLRKEMYDLEREISSVRQHLASIKVSPEDEISIKSNFTEEEWSNIGWIIEKELKLTIYLIKQGYELTAPNIKEIIIQESWQDIHPDFNYSKRKKWEKEKFDKAETKGWIEIGLKLTDYNNLNIKEWKSRNFDYQQVKKWIEAGFNLNDYSNAERWRDSGLIIKEIQEWLKSGLKKNEFEFVVYLKHKGYQYNTPNIEEIIYAELWQDVHSDLNYQLRKNWEEAGFSKEETKKWIEIGFNPKEYGKSEKWKNKGFSEERTREWIQAGSKKDDYEFISWLRDTKKLGLEWISNYQQDYETLSNRFKKYGLCSECNQPNTGEQWCQVCNSQHFKAEFSSWTSNNPTIDSFIQKHQLEATETGKLLEWIPYEQFTDTKYLDQGGFSKVYKAEWSAGNIHHWDSKNKEWAREKDGKKIQKLEKEKKTLEEKVNNLNKKEEVMKQKIYDYLSQVEQLTSKVEEKEKEAVNFVNLIKEKRATELEKQLKEEIELINRKITQESNYKTIVLKSLTSSSETNNFLQETANHKIIDDWFDSIVPCYGISQDSNTGDYLMVMEYIEGGNLRNYLTIKKLDFTGKLKRLTHIIQGLKDVHQKNLVHRDFHSGNILNNEIHSFITDLGLCKLSSEVNKEDEIFGVLPYVAPEVLRNKGYTLASDIYSLGIVTYEIFANQSPYLDREYDVSLSLEICKGLRPDLNNLKIPQKLKDLIRQCWDTDPTKRPTANELERTLRNWQIDTEFHSQLQTIEAEYNQFSQNTTYKLHPTALMTSKRIDTKQITKLLESSEINTDNSTQEQTLLETEEIAPIEFHSQIQQPPK